jgi:hypothetical protein
MPNRRGRGAVDATVVPGRLPELVAFTTLVSSWIGTSCSGREALQAFLCPGQSAGETPSGVDGEGEIQGTPSQAQVSVPLPVLSHEGRPRLIGRVAGPGRRQLGCCATTSAGLPWS